MTNQEESKIELEYIETHLVDHCNLNCKGCSHFCPLSEEKFYDVETFERDIRRLAELFDNIACIRLMGGEPLLHPRVADFMKAARNAFPRAVVKLVTNGILLLRQPEDFWKSCSENNVAIDLTPYPLKLDHERIEKAAALRGVSVYYNGPIGKEQRVVYFDKYLNMKGDSDPAAAFRYCMSMRRCYFLQEGRIHLCRLPVVIHIFNDYFGKNISVHENDSIGIHEDVSGAAILQFLRHPSPFCRWCLLGYPKIEWGITEKKEQEWVPDDQDLVNSRTEHETYWNGIKLRTLVDEGKFEDGLALIQSAESRSEAPTETARWQYLSAYCFHVTEGDLSEALLRYGRALDYGFEEFWVRYNRGALQMRLENKKEAREDLTRALELNPEHDGPPQLLQQIGPEKKNRKWKFL